MIALATLLPGSLVEAGVVLLSHTREPVQIGATWARLISILGRQLFLSAAFGTMTQTWLAPSGLVLGESIATAVGLAIILYVIIRAPVELKVFIAFSFAVLALGLARPLAGSPDRPQWELLCVPGCGNRYYFLAMLATLASIVWILGNTSAPQKLRYFCLGLLMLMPIGIYQDWIYPPFKDLNFQQYAAQFEEAPAGTKVSIPINPDMVMEVVKR